MLRKLTRTPIPALVGMLIATVGFLFDVHAVADKDNQGRWEKPTENNAPDKEVPGFLVNLGPTGARAVLTERTFIVRYIFKDSPAVGRLNIGDVITGVFGKPFSPHTFGGVHGYEGPIMDFGMGIEAAEGKDGKLVLDVSRGAETSKVTIDLEAIGTFSPTFPMQCRKSELLRAKALKYFADHPETQGVWQSHAHSAVTLALLTSDDPKQQAIGKKMAQKWGTEIPNAGTWTWNLSYQLITLCEYHLMTKDASVLPTIKALVNALEKAQYQGRILVWGPTGDKSLEKEDYAKVDALQQLYDGGFGHGPYVPGVGKNGYGPMQYTTLLAITAWQLAGRCGVEAGPDRIKRSLEFNHRCTNAAGAVGYGGEFCLAFGIHDPAAYKKSTGGDNYVGRVGAAIIAHKLSPEFPESAEYIEKFRSYFKRAYKSLPDGHADSNLGIMWGLLGAAASEDDVVLRTVLDYHKAFFNMMRCHDGSFVLLPGRDYADNGYYMASRYHPTATMALVFGLANPKLLIQGVQVSIPGVNPKALKGKLDAAYKAIVKKAYGEAASALKGAKGEDAEAASAMAAYLDAQLQRDVAGLEALEKAGDIYRLDAELAKVRAKFGPFDGLKERISRFEEGLRQDAWKMEMKLGANYRQLVDALQRNKGAAYAGDLEKFGEKHPESLYGKWALEVAKEFRASGSIKDPSVSKPVAIAPAGTTPAAPSAGAAASAAPASTTAVAAKDTPAKPAPPPSKTAAVSAEALDAWQGRFVKKLDALAKSGVRLILPMGGQESYAVRGANEKSLIVSIQGNDLPMPWKQLPLGTRAALAKAAAKDDDVETLLIAAVFQLATGNADAAEDLFAKAALKDADAAKAAKAGLAPH
ncbi:MAG: DUF6288 domain-containing protein [Planctomycetota bacterium]|nr:DUF6288 domain-containing protein [Planctomycetota bacterium]